MDELKMNNAPKWADYVVVYSQERAKVTGLGRSTRYFKSLEKAAAYAARIDEVVLKVKVRGGRRLAPANLLERGNRGA